MSAYFAVGLWHHWLVRRDIRFVERYWPSVRAALDWVVSLQEPFGGIRWTPVDDFCLLTGNSSHLPLAARGRGAGRPDGRPAARVGARRRPAGPRGPRAPRPVRRQVAPTRWTGTTRSSVAPVRGRGRVRAARVAVGRLRRTRPRHPLRRHQPLGHRRRDLRARHGARPARGPPPRAAAVHATCSTCGARTAGTGPAGSTATRPTRSSIINAAGEVEPRNVHWPHEHTTYTAAAVILAADALGETFGHSSPGSGIMRGTSLAPHFAGDRARVRLPVTRAGRPPRLTAGAAPASSRPRRPPRTRRSRGPAGRSARTAAARRPRDPGTRRGSRTARPASPSAPTTRSRRGPAARRGRRR